MSQCNSLEIIGWRAFYDCKGLTSITIPNSVTNIGDSAFEDCSALTSVTFHCKEIGNWFNGIKSIKNIEIGDEVTSIGEYAFYDCKGLTSITIPNSVTNIGDRAFKGCSALTSVTFHCKEIGDWFNCIKSIKNIEIGDEVTSIGKSAFNNCENLQVVDMSQCNSLEIIGEWAFSGCSSAEFVFPEEFESLKCIDYCAFEECKKITSFPFSKALNKMESDAFIGCSNLQILDFSKCTELGNINYGIVFKKGLDSLKKIILPPSQTAFNALCVWTPNVHIGKATNQAEVDMSHCNFKKVWKIAFQTMDMKEIIIPDTVESIGENAFDECEDLKTIVMPAALKEIQAPLGSKMEELRRIDFSKVRHLEIIPKDFIGYGCDKLKELIIPQGVIEIEDDAFAQIYHLKRLFLPPTLESIGEFGLTNVSIYCFSPSLEELEPIVYGWDDENIKIDLFVLPQHFDKYIAQRDAERIPEDVLVIQEIPEEYQYYYDN